MQLSEVMEQQQAQIDSLEAISTQSIGVDEIQLDDSSLSYWIHHNSPCANTRDSRRCYPPIGGSFVHYFIPKFMILHKRAEFLKPFGYSRSQV